MRKLVIPGLIVLNVLLAVALLATPARTLVTRFTRADCCWGEGTAAYCCRECCWLVKNCDRHSECKPDP